ncbi:POK18 protein, partial [Machaerirhynchus nigripectus]|nr:POK18 protein [Machaerirhynchus nigripectus]
IRSSTVQSYLGLRIGKQTIVPQQLTIKDNPKTLRDLHQLCGSINWVHSLLGITTEDLDSLRNITLEAQESIRKVQEALSSQQVQRMNPTLTLSLIILGKSPRFHSSIFFQWDTTLKDPLLIIKWVFLQNQPVKTITTPQQLMAQLIIKARACLRTLVGCDFICIYLPLTTGVLDHLLQTNEHLQFTLDSYTGRISIHRPSHKLFNSGFHLAPKSMQSQMPLKALTISIMTWRDPKTQKWESVIKVVEGSPQIAELAAIVGAFERFKEPINLVTDSAYV